MTHLTPTETKLIADGYRHMVDLGYGRLDTAQDVLKVLAVALEGARREQRISKMRHEANPGADTVVMFLEPTLRNLTMRTEETRRVAYADYTGE